MTLPRAMGTVLVVALLAGGLLYGDDDKAPPKKASLPTGWSKLGLNAEQKQKIQTIQNDYRARIDALRKQIADLQQQERADLVKVLTPVQRKRLEQILGLKGDSDSVSQEEKKGPAERKGSTDKKP